MSVNVSDLKCKLAQNKWEQLLSDKYFVETCFSRKHSSYSSKQQLKDGFFELGALNIQMCNVREIAPVCTTSTTTTTTFPSGCRIYTFENDSDGRGGVDFKDCYDEDQSLFLDPEEFITICGHHIHPDGNITVTIGAECNTTTTTTTIG